MIKRYAWDEEYFDWYYNKGGMETTFMGADTVSPASVGSTLKKAIGPWDPPTSPYGSYFDSKYSAVVQAYTARASEVYKLLPKTTYLQEGDSMKYYETDLTSLTGLGQSGAPFTTSVESGPTIATLTNLYPAVLTDAWETEFRSRLQSQWQNAPNTNPAWLKMYHTEFLPNQIDNMLTQTIDTVANDGSSNLDLESIDRIISSSVESSATYCSAAADGDLFWGNTSAKIDRDADTDNTFGGGGGTDAAGISLPGSAAARVLSLDYIDDVVAAILPYSKSKRYICITGNKTINEWQKLIDPKQRFLDASMDVQIGMNGVSTRPGTRAGFSVASYLTNGIQVPVFGTQHAANETAGNRSATVTDADIGNIYFVDLDHIEMRMAFPITYMEGKLADMMNINALKVRHMFILSGQLMASNYRAHGAVKYLKST